MYFEFCAFRENHGHGTRGILLVNQSAFRRHAWWEAFGPTAMRSGQSAFPNRLDSDSDNPLIFQRVFRF